MWLTISEAVNSLSDSEKWIIGIILTLSLPLIIPLAKIIKLMVLHFFRKIWCIIPYRIINIKKILALTEWSKSLTWEIVEQSGEEILRIQGEWTATNRTDEKFILLLAEFTKFKVSEKVVTNKAYVPHPDSTEEYDFELWPNSPAPIIIFFDKPTSEIKKLPAKTIKNRENIVSNIVITDSNGIKHCLRKVTFKYKDKNKQQ